MQQQERKVPLKEEDVFTKLPNSFFMSGLVATIGRNRAMTLLGIASYMNEEGKCFPSQERIAERLGISTRTLREDIKFLEQFRVEGKEILRVASYPTEAGHRKHAYRVMPISQLSRFADGKIEKIKTPLVELESENFEAKAREEALRNL
ncbi:MAG: helix-turn-helix domain-containing protein [Bacillota bacterium]|nr:helix-turn-helix domain-containing protein [Bacillota bacterium]